ncbi:MAG: hypothetical protein J7L75_02170 [Thermoproteales archaeon]|nr:hypothetical protein [Thermoproteales archaeon]
MQQLYIRLVALPALMCDIYTARCMMCGRGVEMHLADFNTQRWEVHVICDECLRELAAREGGVWTLALWACGCVGWVLWRDEGGRYTLVISATANAWANREGNHPNTYMPEVVCEHVAPSAEAAEEVLKQVGEAESRFVGEARRAR